MKSELLDILVDPQTQEPLGLKNAVYINGEIDEGELISPSGNNYPIRHGIPRFVDVDNYANSFGLQWNRFSRTQLDSVNEGDYSKKRFKKEVKWDKEWAKGKWILDAGCGSGRFAEIAADSGCNLVALDMSNAVDAAKANLSGLRNINFIQADMFHLPFRQFTFDGVYSIGVLQHTPDPYAAICYLLGMVSSGGQFAFTIYAKRLWTKLYSKYWARAILKGIKEEKLLSAVEKIMPVAFPVTDVLFRIPFLGKLFRFLIPIANYIEKGDMTRKQRYEEAVLDTFDMLTPQFDFPVTAPRVIDVIRRCGVADYKMLSRFPVNIVGNKKTER